MPVTKATLEVVNIGHDAGEFLNDDKHCSNVVQVGKGSAVQTQWWDMVAICNREILKNHTHVIRQHKANPIHWWYFWNDDILKYFITRTGVEICRTQLLLYCTCRDNFAYLQIVWTSLHVDIDLILQNIPIHIIYNSFQELCMWFVFVLLCFGTARFYHFKLVHLHWGNGISSSISLHAISPPAERYHNGSHLSSPVVT